MRRYQIRKFASDTVSSDRVECWEGGRAHADRRAPRGETSWSNASPLSATALMRRAEVRGEWPSAANPDSCGQEPIGTWCGRIRVSTWRLSRENLKVRTHGPRVLTG